MYLDEWLAEERERLMRFENMWRKENNANPEHYPLTMEPSDWDEAIATFSE